MLQKKILVTGGAGYIGSHVVLALQQAGYGMVILDSLEYGHRDLVERVLQTELIIGNINDRALLDQLFAKHKIDAVMHFAAYALVGESTQHPDRYYRNNVMGTLTLLEAMRAAGIDKFVFSSTCSVYGVSPTIPLLEDTPLAPINPYATSKLMVENILADFDQSYGFRSVRFRYFNAAGADPQGRLGEDHTPETHLIPLVLLAALGLRKNITVFGTDYDTADGTCIRDYIHVSDLATAHVLGLKYLISGGQSQVFNLGNGDGFSVKEIIATAQAVTGKKIEVIYGDRRAGDPPILLGSNAKARQMLNWQPQYSDISDIIDHAWQWHQRRHIAANDISISEV
jgi:UDP-glucose 4-epimerase